MRTLTWDQGREMARHQRLTPGTGVEVFFAHPHSPWERGTNENTNRLIRRYLPKGTPITSHQPYLDAIAHELGNCPRATLDYHTPTQAFNELIATTHRHRRTLGVLNFRFDGIRSMIGGLLLPVTILAVWCHL